MGSADHLLLRALCDRARERLVWGYGSGRRAGVLAAALGHACYPDATFGDHGPEDETIRLLERFTPRPADSQAAWKLIEEWLHRGELHTRDLFLAVWQATPGEFLERFFTAQRQFERHCDVDVAACYATLEIENGASLEQIEEAYKALVLAWHPDRFGHDDGRRSEAEAKLKQINQARDCLLAHHAPL